MATSFLDRIQHATPPCPEYYFSRKKAFSRGGDIISIRCNRRPFCLLLSSCSRYCVLRLSQHYYQNDTFFSLHFTMIESLTVYNNARKSVHVVRRADSTGAAVFCSPFFGGRWAPSQSRLSLYCTRVCTYSLMIKSHPGSPWHHRQRTAQHSNRSVPYSISPTHSLKRTNIISERS